MPATSFKTIQLDLWSHYSNLTFIYIVIQDRNIDMQKLYKISIIFIQENKIFSKNP